MAKKESPWSKKVQQTEETQKTEEELHRTIGGLFADKREHEMK